MEPLIAQSSVSGTVQDVDASPVPYCNAFLRQNGLIKNLTTTNDNGYFRFENLDSGRYEFVVSAIGYKKHTQVLHLDRMEVKVEVVLLPDTVVLDQVIVHGDAPIRIKGDTVVYDAGYFKSGDEVALADLLRKLPGLSVGEDGKIKFQGKNVSRIKIEDDDLFESNYQLLTKNLPASWVEQVEVLQHYSNNPLLKDIEESDEVALNLTLKDNRKNKLLGDLRGGTDLSNRYEGRVNLASIQQRTKWYVLSSANSLGEDPAGSIEELISPSATGATLAGDGVSSDFLVPMTKPNIPEFRRDRYYNNQAAFGSVQGIHKFSKKLSLKLVAYGYRDAVDFAQASRSDYFTPYDTVRFNEVAATNHKESLWHFAGDVNWRPRDKITLQYKAKVEGMSSSAGLRSNFNQQSIVDDMDASASRQDHALLVTRRPSEKSAFVVHGRYISDNRPQEYRVEGNVLGPFFSPLPSSDTLLQASSFDTRFVGGDVQWYHRLKKARLGIRARVTSASQELGNQLTSTATLSVNNLEYRKQEVSGEVYYAWRTGNWVFTPSVQAQRLDVALNDRQGGNTSFLLPRLSMKWEGSKSSLTVIYNLSGQVSDPYQLTRNAILRRYNTVALQDPSFRSFSQRTLLATYQWGGWGRGFSLLTSLFHQDSPAAYLPDLDVEPNYTVATTDRVADRSMTSYSMEADKYFTPLYTNLKVKWIGNRSSFVTSVESVSTSTISTGHMVDVSLRTALPGPLNVHGGHIWQVATSSSDLLSATNYTSMLFLDGYLKALKQRLTVTLHWERYEINSFEGRPVFHFMDLSANWRIKEGFEVYAKGRNLLSETVYAQRSISSQNTIEFVNPLINKYILIGLQFQL